MLCWIQVAILKLGWSRFWSISFMEILKMKFDQDMLLNLWYELNPRVHCAFGKVYIMPVVSFTAYLYKLKLSNQVKSTQIISYDKWSFIVKGVSFWAYSQASIDNRRCFPGFECHDEEWFCRKMNKQHKVTLGRKYLCLHQFLLLLCVSRTTVTTILSFLILFPFIDSRGQDNSRF